MKLKFFLLAILLISIGSLCAQIKLVHPQNDLVQTDSKVRFALASYDEVDEFLIEIDTNQNFLTSNIYSFSGTDTLIDLIFEGTYFWRGGANLNSVFSGWSGSRNLSIINLQEIGDLKLWLKPDIGIQLTGNKVFEWSDVSGNELHAHQSTLNQQPTYISNTPELNNYPSVSFDGNDVLNTPNLGLLDVEIFAIVKGNLVNNRIFGFGSQAGLGYYYNFSSSRPIIFLENTNYRYFEGLQTTGEYQIHNLGYIDGNAVNNATFLNVNGDNKSYSNGVSTSSFTLNNLTIGSGNLNGSFVEIVVFDSLLNQNERSKILNYLRNKYTPKLNLEKIAKSNYSFCDTTLNAEKAWFTSYNWSNGVNTASFTSSFPGGVYQLEVVDIFGFTSRDTIEIFYKNRINQINDTNICKSEQFTWDTQLPNTYSFLWSTGATDSAISISQEGNYWVQVTDSFGCSITSDTIFVSLDEFSKIASLGPDTALCLGDEIGLLNGADLAVNFNWSTGENSARIVPQNSGTFILAATGASGCEIFDTIQVSLAGFPPTLNIDFADACAKDSIAFTDLSSPAFGDSLVAWEWNFGDGNTSLLQNPIHAYENGGTYEVSLKVTTGTGCNAIITDSIEVYFLPELDLQAGNACSNQTLFLNDASSSNSGVISSIVWKIYAADSSFIDSATASNFSFVPNDSGSYFFQGTATNSLQCKAEKDSTIFVNLSPTASFTRDSACTNESIQFFSTASGDGLQYSWNFESISSLILQGENIQNAFNTAGNYPLRHWVIDTNNCSDTVLMEIAVSAPTAFNQIDTNQILCSGDVLIWNLNLDSNLFAFEWQDSSSKNFIQIENAGNFSVAIEDSLGCRFNSNTVRVVVDNFPTIASLGSDTAICAGNSIGLVSGNNQAIAYLWNTNDDSSRLVIDTTGLYFLISQNANGCTSVDSIFVTVSGVAPELTLLANNLCTDDSATIADVSTLPIGQNVVARTWSINQQVVNTDSSFQWVFNQNGLFDIRLNVETDLGCFAEKTQTIEVYDLPQANFTSSLFCSNQEALLQGSSSVNSGSIASELFIVTQTAGSDTLSGNAVSVQLLDSGNATILYTVFSTFSCKGEKQVQLPISKTPNPSFTVNRNCADENSVFTANQSNNISNYQWLVNDSAAGNGSAFNFQPNFSGMFTVKLILESDDACVDSSESAIYLSLPDSNLFTPENFDLCLYDSVLWNTQLPDTFNFLWNTGENSSSIFIKNQGNYFVQITDTSECSYASNTLVVGIDSFPETTKLGADTSLCSGNSISLASGANEVVQYNWSTGENSAEIAIFNSGNYILAATNNNACTAIDSVFVNVLGEAPVVDFSIDNTCFKDSVFAVNNSIAPAGASFSQFAWSFGNGDSSMQENPSYFYSAPGIYEVTLTAFTNEGCDASFSKNIEIYKLPKAQFANNRSCSNLETVFINQSQANSGTINSNKWIFSSLVQGFLDSSMLSNPAFIFENSAIHQVKLIVESSFSCKDSVSKLVNTIASPIANFEVSDFCVGAPSQFTNTSSGLISSYFWEFGNGNTSTQESPNYAYFQAGTYTVNLRVNSSLGCFDTLKKDIQIFDFPTAQILSDDQLCVNDTFYFEDNSNSGTLPLIERVWLIKNQLQDSIFGSSSVANAFKFASPGVYDLWLTVADSAKCAAYDQKQITVLQAPNAQFSSNYACINNGVIFDNLTQENGLFTSYSWDFGDGVTTSFFEPGHAYTQIGEYEVKLTATASNSCQSIYTDSVFYSNIEDLAYFIPDTLICADSSLIWDSNLDTNLFDVLWNIGSKSQTIQINQGGNYGFTAHDKYNCQVSDSANVLISSFETSTSLGPDKSICAGDAIKLENGAEDAQNYFWSTGEFTPEITVSQLGMYSVSVSNSIGCIAADTIFISVIGPQPEANFSFTPICIDDTLILTDSSLAVNQQVNSWQWIVNQTDTFSGNSIQFLPSNLGSLQVLLKIESDSGCTDTIYKQIQPYAIPTASFGFSSLCTDKDILFNNTSSTSQGAIASQRWILQDGLVSDTLFNFDAVYKFQNAGLNRILLEIENSFACIDSISFDLTFLQTPQISVSKSALCNNAPITFQDNSTVNSLNSRNWTFSNGLTSTADSVTFLLPTAAVYSYQLLVADNNGCSDTLIENFTVNPPPFVPNLQADTTICSGDIFTWDLGIDSSMTAIWPNGYSGNSFDIAAEDSIFARVIDSNLCEVVTPAAIISENKFRDLISLGNDTSFCLGNSIKLKQGAHLVQHYLWPDGSTQDSFVVNSNSSIILAVFDSMLCQGVDTINVSIAGAPPSISLQIPNICVGTSVQIQDNTSAAPGESIASTHFQIIGGASVSNANPITLTFNQPGIYHYEYTAVTNNACSEILSDSLVVFANPKADFLLGLACSRKQSDFFDNSTAGSNSIVNWLWNFSANNANIAVSNLQNTKVIYPNGGIKTISLQVSDAFGCSHDTSKAIFVTHSPIADFLSDSVCLGNRTQFTNTSSGSGISSLFWQFGDGNFSSNNTPNHVYANPGIFNVSLNVVDNQGCRDTVIKEVLVNIPPNADFSMDSLCQGQTSFFYNTSTNTNPIEFIHWQFGSTNIYHENNPGFAFSNSGNNLISLTVVDNQGCRDSVSRVVEVHSLPEANFTFNPPFSGAPVQLAFNNTSFGAANYRWYINDSIFSISESPEIILNVEGDYRFGLWATNEHSCSDSITKNYLLRAPLLDASMKNIKLVDLGDFYEIEIEVENLGNRLIEQLDLAISISNSNDFKAEWLGKLPSGTSISHTLNGTFSKVNDQLPEFVCATITGVENGSLENNLSNNEQCALNRSFKLISAYPSPSKGDFFVQYSLAEVRDVRLSLHNQQGIEVWVYQQSSQAPGVYNFVIPGANIRSGIYQLLLNVSGAIESKTLVKF